MQRDYPLQKIESRSTAVASGKEGECAFVRTPSFPARRGGRAAGFFLDLAANHPRVGSKSYFFETCLAQGWPEDRVPRC